MGRATQGVRLIKVRGDDSIAAVAKVMHDEDAVEDIEGNLDGETENGTIIDNDDTQTETQE
jgi:DNA gyrase subunit A